MSQFLANYTDIIQMFVVVEASLVLPLMKLHTTDPVDWLNLLDDDFQTEACHLVECCFVGLMSPQAFTRSLIPQNLFPRGVTAWATDLGLNIELSDWYNICRKVTNIPSPKLQDFHLQFLNRAYYLNAFASKFKNVDKHCSLCRREEETYMHLFWNCPRVTNL